MIITKSKIAFTAEEAFGALHHINRQAWEDAIDLIAAYARERYQEIYGAEDDCLPLEDGVQFDASHHAIFFAEPN